MLTTSEELSGAMWLQQPTVYLYRYSVKMWWFFPLGSRLKMGILDCNPIFCIIRTWYSRFRAVVHEWISSSLICCISEGDRSIDVSSTRYHLPAQLENFCVFIVRYYLLQDSVLWRSEYGRSFGSLSTIRKIPPAYRNIQNYREKSRQTTSINLYENVIVCLTVNTSTLRCIWWAL